jgi:hypothetical protein
MLVVLRGAKKLLVDTVFGGSLKAVDVGTVLVEILADCEGIIRVMPLAFLYFPEVVALGR